MKTENTPLPAELEALGREAVAALHLAEDMKLDEERVRNITYRRHEMLWTACSWAGAACALFVGVIALLPHLSDADGRKEQVAAREVCFDRDEIKAENGVMTFAAVSESAAAPAAAASAAPEMAYGASAPGKAKPQSRGRKVMATMKNSAAKMVPAEENAVMYDHAAAAGEDALPENSAAETPEAERSMAVHAVLHKRNVPAAEGFTDPETEPFSTFSIDSDRGSYQLACQILRNGGRPHEEDIRIEQFVNSPEYPSYPQPEKDKVLKPFLTLAPHPFRPGSHIMRAALQGSGAGSGRSGLETKFAVIIDKSGSMAIGNAAAEAEAFLKAFSAENGNAAEVIFLNDAFAQMPGALEECAAKASGCNIAVILVSDLRWIPDKHSRNRFLETVKHARNRGVRLHVAAFGGVGREPVSDECDISADQWAGELSEAGGGIYLRAADSRGAMEMLGNELQGRFQILADDVKIQVEFDPDTVAAYRLMGYERRMMDAGDFRNDQVRAAPLVRGGQVTALYEVILHPGAVSGRTAVMNVRYREPGGLGFAEEKTAVNAGEQVDIHDDEDFMASAVIAEWAHGLSMAGAGGSIGTDVLLQNMPGGERGRFAEYFELIRLSR